MAKVDVVVIGAGAAGLTAAALLAKEGKKVTVVEASKWLGGRGMAVPDEGFKLNLGGHLLEDSGSGITKVLEYVGKKLEHGNVSSDLPVWDHNANRWGSIRDRYSGDKSQLKKVVAALKETPYEALDDWDDRPLREWMHQHTRDQGVIDLWEFLSVLECMTEPWYDHSASENLYVRKMHYSEARMAGYTIWPKQGWDGMFKDLHDAVIEQGGEERGGTPVETVYFVNESVKGVMLGRDKILPNEFMEGEVLEADAVISTLPVWNVLRVVPESALPDWYVGQIKYLAQDSLRISWIGLYLATREEVHALDPREISTWLHAPTSRLSGFCFNQSAMDPSTAPEGVNLMVAGGIIPGSKAKDLAYVQDMFEKFEADLKVMYPGLKDAYWRRRHLVHDPSCGVIQKPALVGKFRPHWRAPNVEGLYFASETFRSRGIGVDRAARAGLTAVEDYLGRRLDGGFGWRY
jgi:phytoene dehydrogenase-like protein